MKKAALVLACDDRFIPYTAVVARRIARYAAEPFTVFILSDCVTDENKALARKFCPEMEFIDAGPWFERHPIPPNFRFHRSVYMRLFIDELLTGFHRAVYLDSDISLLTDVSPLLHLPMKAGPIAATYDLALIVEGSYRRRLGVTGAYMNGGVAVLDLTAIRSEGLFRAALAYASEYPERCLFAEQDALNAVLDGRWQVLDWRWNSMNYMQERVARTPFIRHFTGNKPWSPRKIGIERRFVNEWRADLSESPWHGRFSEQAPRHAMRAAFEPLSLRVTHLARSLWHSGTDDRRGNKARLANRLPSILSDIERSAANLEKAGAISIQP